jgi:mitochondrial import inner membrane translocase subunit TIM21
MLMDTKNQVQGPKGSGTVQMYLIKANGSSEFKYQYFYLDMPGHDRIYLENANATPTKAADAKKGFKLFGVKWG